MKSLKKINTKKIYLYRRYWYHLSSSLNKEEEHLVPWNNSKGLNRSPFEPDGDRICVAPTIEQCIVALPYRFGSEYTIYRTKDMVRAREAVDVFDSKVTHEGWIEIPTTFVKIGHISFCHIEQKRKLHSVIRQAASVGEASYSGRILNWWKRIGIKKYINRNFETK